MRRRGSGRRAGGRIRWALAVVVSLLPAAGAGAGEVLDPVNPAPGVRTWTWDDGRGARVRLTQLWPDQVRGFYQARGFPSAAAELLAREGCVFQTVVRNVSGSEPVRVSLGEWRVEAGGEGRPLRLVDWWQARWPPGTVPPRARLAMRWALFPVEQVLATGDWSMGMITAGLPRGTAFTLTVRWRRGEIESRGILADMHCATELQ